MDSILIFLTLLASATTMPMGAELYLNRHGEWQSNSANSNTRNSVLLDTNIPPVSHTILKGLNFNFTGIGSEIVQLLESTLMSYYAIMDHFFLHSYADGWLVNLNIQLNDPTTLARFRITMSPPPPSSARIHVSSAIPLWFFPRL